MALQLQLQFANKAAAVRAAKKINPNTDVGTIYTDPVTGKQHIIGFSVDGIYTLPTDPTRRIYFNLYVPGDLYKKDGSKYPGFMALMLWHGTLIEAPQEIRDAVIDDPDFPVRYG